MSQKKISCSLDREYESYVVALERIFNLLSERLLSSETEKEVNRLHIWFLGVQGAHIPWGLISDTKKLERLGELDTIKVDLGLVVGDMHDLWSQSGVSAESNLLVGE